MNLTNFEEIFLLTIPRDCFYEEGFESCLWVDDFLDTFSDLESINSKQSRGILSSLSKKGYLVVNNNWDGNKGIFTLTDKCITYLKGHPSLKLDEYGYLI